MKLSIKISLLTTLCAVILVGCNNKVDIDTSGIYLSKIITNGVLATEYRYNDFKQVDTICQYDFQGKLSTYQTFKYDNGKLFRAYSYSSSNVLVGLYKYQYNLTSSNLDKADYYLAADTATKVNISNTYRFNASNMCDTLFYVDADGISYKTINSYADGNRVQATIVSHDSVKVTLNYAYDAYATFAQKVSAYPVLYCNNNIKSISSADLLSNGGSITSSGVASTKLFSGTGKSLFLGFELKESAYEYNGNGLPTKQVATYTNKTDNKITTEYQYISM